MRRPCFGTPRTGTRRSTKVEGSRRAANTAATKAEATAKGKQMAQKRHVEHIIRNKDGEIGQRNSYGNDPRNIPG
ncbi:DUF2188 domain-containing protein [Amycolatopsis rifamycinica]|uniref:DUF2188 domain-containing protein n=1 Tax=Amycolatopsis rifamycinica TaxID=287986 RepID=UPI00068B02B8|nr:DUF2188 domain-containing protein [Amycolatopsis rifamycinica]